MDTKKIVLVGQIGTGKTSFVKQLTTKSFLYGYKGTIGFDVKKLTIDNVNLELREIAGEELYGNMTQFYYKDADAVLVFVDCTKNATFEEALKWKRDLLKWNVNCPTFIIYNKWDIQDPNHLMIVDPKVIYDQYNFKTMFKISSTIYDHCYNVIYSVIRYLPKKEHIDPIISNNTNPVTTYSKNTNEFIECLLEMMDSENFKLNYLKLCFSFKNRNLLDDDLQKLIKFVNQSINNDDFKNIILNHLTNYL
jgi:small GTP-binding protein